MTTSAAVRSESSSSGDEENDVQIADKPTFCEIRDVRITPPIMIFSNPYEGKLYEERITIQNVGKNPVVIRIENTTSSSIKIKPIYRNRILSPGLCIHRTIRYTVSMMTVIRSCTVPIYVNNQPIYFKIEVRMLKSRLITDPEFIDFGTIDAGPNVSKRKLKMANVTQKPIRYSIDFGSNDLGLAIEPEQKGVVMEYSTLSLNVLLSVLEECDCVSEFWIITDEPICVKVHVHAVMGIIEPIDSFRLCDFTIIRFPRTYYGAKSYKSLLLRNRSQMNSIFCVTGELEKTKHALSDCRNLDGAYKYFDVAPASGRIWPNDIRSFLFTFKPDDISVNKNKTAFVVVVNINKLFCNDLNRANYDDPDIFSIEEKERPVIMSASTHSSADEIEFYSELQDDFQEYKEPPCSLEQFFESSVKIMLYGEMEIPYISITPNELTLKDLILNETAHRVIRLKNRSQHLPIIFKAKKVCFVKVRPATGRLMPLEKLEVEVLITPKSFDILNTQIVFEMLYHDNPDIDKTYNVVGRVKVSLLVHETIISRRKPETLTISNFSLKKSNFKPNNYLYRQMIKEKAILTLPNIRPCSLRPWKDERICRTLYAGIPRLKEVDDEYLLSYSKRKEKQDNKKKYIEYLRQEQAKHKKEVVFLDYEISMPKAAVCLPQISQEEVIENKLNANFLPLTPEQLFKIKISPRNWMIEKIVALSYFTNEVQIKNENDFDIRIFFKPLKPQSFNFSKGRHAIVNAHSELNQTFLCYSSRAAIEYLTMDIIINENHVFETAIIIRNCQKLLKLSFTQCKFAEDEPLYKYLELGNEYNIPIEFYWEYAGDFDIRPISGTVAPGKSLTCIISYELGKCTLNNYEIILRVDNKRCQSVRICVETFNLDNLQFISQLCFENVSLGVSMQRKVLMKNKIKERIPFTIDTDDLVNGLYVYPTSGVIFPGAAQYFRFQLQRFEVGEFTCRMVLTLGYHRQIFVEISGNILIPNLTFTPPKLLKFRKIAASSFDTKCLTITNNDNLQIMFKFDLNYYPELRFSEYSDGPFIQNDQCFTINPYESKTYVIHLYPFNSVVSSFTLPIIANIPSIGYTNTLIKSDVKLSVSVLPHRLIIKSWTYNFKYFPFFDYKSVTKHKISISSKSYVKFCIRLDDMRMPFNFIHKSGGIITNYDYSITCELSPNEEVTFIATFSPQKPGKFSAKLPLFIKDDYIKDCHNNLKFNAIYPFPDIVCSEDPIFLGFVPINFAIEKQIQIKLKFHEPSCNLVIFCPDIYINCIHKPIVVGALKEVYNITFHYCANYVHELKCYVRLYCNCGNKFQRNVDVRGATENSILTNYTTILYFKSLGKLDYLIKICEDEIISHKSSMTMLSTGSANIVHTIEHTLPLFPSANNCRYFQDMVKFVNIAENYLYEQGYGQVFYKIPDSICQFELLQKRESHRKTISVEYDVIDLPFKKFLVNVCGYKIEQLFPSKRYFPGGQTARALYASYKELLIFLSDIGAMVFHIEPEYLFTYSYYKKFIINTKSKKLYSFIDFCLLSKQCWLDLILQTIKVVILSRITYMPPTVSFTNLRSNIPRTSEEFAYVRNNLHSRETLYLLKWINNRLKQQKRDLLTLIFPDHKMLDEEYLMKKEINNFDSDLTDGLGFLAVTLYACPYMVRRIGKMYVEPNNSNESFHNACVLINVWNALNITYTIFPEDIVRPNFMQMFLFVCYLHEFLLKLKPKKTLKLTANICEYNTDSFEIINELRHDILKYKIIIFNDDCQVFSIDSENVVVPPNSTVKVFIKYHAKYAQKHHATLLLSGETRGSRSAESRAYNLEGIPYFYKPYTDISILSVVYVSKKFVVKLQGPHRKEIQYELFFAKERPQTIEGLTLTPYSFKLQNNILSRLVLDSHLIKSESNGEIKISGYVCSITTNTRTLYLFARNKVYGDLLIYFNIIPEINLNNSIELTLKLSERFQSLECQCEEHRKCQRIVNLQIPCRNKYMWNAVMAHFFFDICKGEKQFLKENEDSNFFINMLFRILKDHKGFIEDDMLGVFREKVEFLVKYKANTDLKMPERIVINTLGAQEYTDIPVHLNSNLAEFSFRLKCSDAVDTEVRNYKVKIIYVSDDL